MAAGSMSTGLQVSRLTRDERVAGYTMDGRMVTVYATECTCAQFHPMLVDLAWGESAWICRVYHSAWTNTIENGEPL